MQRSGVSVEVNQSAHSTIISLSIGDFLAFIALRFCGCPRDTFGYAGFLDSLSAHKN